MADKQVPLSIVIRTVDKATAGINAVNKRLDELTRPTRELGKALSGLAEKSGLNRVSDAFGGVKSAVGDLLSKVALVGGALALAVHGVLGLVDEFDNLGDTAERLGTTPDFLAAIRFAAERAGAPIEGVDSALQALTVNMGAAKAGMGRMLKFLNQISPTFARQITKANSLEEALGLLAAASEKLPDAARRNKLAAVALGDAALAPLLARGPAGIQELLARFADLAPGMGDAATAAGKTDDALKDLHASTLGVKGALVTGLAPALTVVINKLTEWLKGHREDVKRWAEDIGKRLPAAVDKIVDAVKGAVKWVGGFVDGIGGWKVAALGVAAVITGPLISAIAALGLAMSATPFGVFLAGLGAIALLAKTIHDTGGPRSSASFAAERTVMLSGALPGRNEHQPTSLESRLMQSGALPKSRQFRLGEGRWNALGREAKANIDATRAADEKIIGPNAEPSNPFTMSPIQIKVDFGNAPKGMRATVAAPTGAKVDTTTGYNMGLP